MTWHQSKRSVLVPYDFSERCDEALRTACRFVEDQGCVSVLHVVHPPIVTAPGIVWAGYDEEDIRARTYKALQEGLKEKDFPKVEAHVLMGSPADAVVDFAKESGTELIVIPSHSRKGLDRLLMGSVSERVVRRAPCDVLVLRASKDQS